MDWKEIAEMFTPPAVAASAVALWAGIRGIWRMSATVTKAEENMGHTAKALRVLSEQFTERCQLEDRRYDEMNARIRALEQK